MDGDDAFDIIETLEIPPAFPLSTPRFFARLAAGWEGSRPLRHHGGGR
jgi:hypothetical protein